MKIVDTGVGSNDFFSGTIILFIEEKKRRKYIDTLKINVQKIELQVFLRFLFNDFKSKIFFHKSILILKSFVQARERNLKFSFSIV